MEEKKKIRFVQKEFVGNTASTTKNDFFGKDHCIIFCGEIIKFLIMSEDHESYDTFSNLKHWIVEMAEDKFKKMDKSNSKVYPAYLVIRCEDKTQKIIDVIGANSSKDLTFGEEFIKTCKEWIINGVKKNKYPIHRKSIEDYPNKEALMFLKLLDKNNLSVDSPEVMEAVLEEYNSFREEQKQETELDKFKYHLVDIFLDHIESIPGLKEEVKKRLEKLYF